jgi:PAS domain S-box-containing protein
VQRTNALKIRVKVMKGGFLMPEKPSYEELEQRVKELEKEAVEHKRAEEPLPESEEYFRSLIENALDGVMVVDGKGTINYQSPSIGKILGYKPEEVVGKRMSEFIYSGDESYVMEAFSRVIQNPCSTRSLQLRVQHKDGSLRIIEGIANNLLDSPHIRGIVINFRDITDRKRTEEALRESEAQKKAILDASIDRVRLIDKDMNILWANKTTVKELNVAPEDIVGQPCYKILQDRNVPCDKCPTKKALESGKTEHGVIHQPKSKGIEGETYWDSYGVPIKNESGDIVNLIQITRNATERKQAEEALRESEERYRTILDSIEEAYFEVDIRGNLTFFNDSLCKLLGYTKDQLMGMNNRVYMTQESSKRIYKHSNEMYRTGNPIKKVDFEIIRKDGSHGFHETSASLMRDRAGQPIGFRGISRDVTERKQAEEKIQASLREKEVLLKEIHHRVKNNLQVVSSLLSLQSGYAKDREALEMFKESQNRVRSMALIHEKLYQSKDFARIDIAGYIQDLTTSLFRSYGTSAADIKLNIDVKDIFLDINTSIPCGLIINELVSNSLKHAFPDGREGEIKIAMQRINENKIKLIVGDNGIGFPKDIDFRNTESLGMQVVITLAEQLDGTIELDKSSGTTFRIGFSQ